MDEYTIYATVLNSLHELAVTDKSDAASAQLTEMLTDLDEHGYRVIFHEDTQSYTVSDMPKA